MGGLFSKPKRAKVPPTPAPTPMPQQLDEDVMKKSLDRRRRMLAALGREGTILTREQLGGTKSLLGETSP